MAQRRRFFHLSPPQTITLSFAAMILVGAALLTLPVASQSGQSVGFVNALFTATSANCVTGLVVVTTATHWTVFGKVVILLLIQLGGLGFITVLTLSMVLLRRRIPLRSRLVIQASFNQDSPGGMVRFVKSVIGITLFIEGFGAVALAFAFYAAGGMTGWQAVGGGIFHSISAFCNAGFDILGPDSLVPYAGNLAVNLIIMFLIIAGGLGFLVWGDLITAFRSRKKHSVRTRLSHLSLHSKIALCVTGLLIVSGLLLFLLLEWNNPATLGPLAGPQKVLAGLFQSVTLRTCGFFTIPQGGLTGLSKLIASTWMFIGGSPAGTAGGIKTVTLGVVAIAMLSALRGRGRMQAFGRALPLELLQKALTVIFTLLVVVLLSVLALHFTEQAIPFEHDVLDLIFETTSAAGTVGLTTGITPYLTTAGRLVLTLCMFLGRLSPVTVAVALNMRLHATQDNVGYPTERVIIG